MKTQHLIFLFMRDKMEKIAFEELKKKVARKKSIYALKSKIEDFEFKIIEYGITIESLKDELIKAKESLKNLESFEE